MRFTLLSSAAAAIVALALPTNALLYNVSLNSQVRLAYSGTAGMTVSWNTYQKLANPTVMYGFAPDALVYSASSKVSVTYATSLTYNNHVKISGLQPDTKYYYMPEDLLKDEFTRPPYSFKTPRVTGDTTPFSVAVVIDMGTFGPEGLTDKAGPGVSPNNILLPGEQTTITSLAKAIDTYDFLMHPGDIAYADTWLKEALTGFINATIADGYKAYESILDGFYNQMTPITTLRPYMVSPGNHEANCDNGGTGGYNTSICMPGQTNFTGYRNHFRMPSDLSGGVENFWFSYDQGFVHFIHIDTETDFGTKLLGPSEPISGPFGQPNEQLTWLEADLKAVNRTKTPWIVVGGHRPWYSSGSICKNCSAAFEPLFLKYGVDLYLAGHFHVMERMTPIGAKGAIDPNGLNNPSAPWYIVNGAGGHYDGLDSFTYPLMPYHVFGLETAQRTYGWSRLTFHNCSHLTHEFIASNNNTVLDTATLFKNRTCNAGVPSHPSGTSTSSSVVPTTSATKLSTTSSVVLTTSASSLYKNSSIVPTASASSVSGASSVVLTSSASSVPTTSAVVTSTSASGAFTTSTVLTTVISTITKCASTVTNCPADSTVVVTSTIALYTTVCPVTATATATSTSTSTKKTKSKTSTATTSTKPVLTTSVVYTTTLVTVTACPSTVPNCPTGSVTVITSTIPLYTTICPVTPTAPASSTKHTKSAKSTTTTTASSAVIVVPPPISLVTSSSAKAPTTTATIVVPPPVSLVTSSAVTTVTTTTKPAGGASTTTTASASATTTGPVKAGARAISVSLATLLVSLAAIACGAMM